MIDLSHIPAIVLAAGKGERLGALTKATPKPMLPVEGKPVLEHNLEWLKQQGVTRMTINLHHQKEVIRRHFGGGEKWGLDISYSEEKDLLGSAGAVKKIIREAGADGAQTWLVMYGDNFYHAGFDLRQLLARHCQTQAEITIGLYQYLPADLFQGQDDRTLKALEKCGIVFTGQDQRILAFVEKPGPGEIQRRLSDNTDTAFLGVNSGLYLFSARLAETIPEGFSDFAKDVFPQQLKAGGQVFACGFEKGDLVTIDNPELYQQAQHL